MCSGGGDMSCKVIGKERVAIGGDSTTAYSHVEAILYGDEKNSYYFERACQRIQCNLELESRYFGNQVCHSPDMTGGMNSIHKAEAPS